MEEQREPSGARPSRFEVVKERLRAIYLKIPWLSPLYRTLKLDVVLHRSGNFRFVDRYRPGHYYSPLPDYKATLERQQILFERDVDSCAGVNLREETQLELLETFSKYYDELPFTEYPGGATRYYYKNSGWFTNADVIALYSMMRHFKPRKVVEIGSGFSSAAMLDTADLFLRDKVHFTFIEPHPERLYALLTREDRARHTIIESPVQDVSSEVFRSLSANDILFVDSSHVVKIGSDVTRMLFDILPDLQLGTLVHIHDIFWPFEYPKEWVTRGTAWNESYFLRSFLQFNNAFDIIFFNSFLAERHAEILKQKMPIFLEGPSVGGPSSLWLRKVA